MKINKTAEALRAAREERKKALRAAATPATQTQKNLKTKTADELLLVTDTEMAQPLPETHEEKSTPVAPEMAPAAPMAPMAAEGAMPPAATLEMAVELPSGDVDPAAAAAPPPSAMGPEAGEAAEMAEEEDEIMAAYVVDPSRVTVTARIAVSGPFETANDAHWVVMADGEPLAKVQLSDQKIAGDVKQASFRALFLSDQYGASIVSAAKKTPIQQILASINGRYFSASISRSAAVTELRKELTAQADLENKKKQAQFRDNFLSMMSLVTEAQLKNFLTDQPLRTAFFKQLKKAGVHDPVSVIEAAFVEGAQSHFEDMTRWAMRWIDYDANALADIKQQINARRAGYVQYSYETPVAVQAQPLAPAFAPVASSAANVPLVAGTVHTAAPKEKSLKSVFDFRGRHQQKAYTPK